MAKPSRFLDPLARATSFAARKGGMRDDQQAERRMRRVERALYGAQTDDSGETPDSWNMIEEVGDLPAPTPDVVGRMFLQRSEGVTSTLSVGVVAEDGTPVIVGLNTQAPDDGAVALALESALSFSYVTRGVAIDASANVYIVADAAINHNLAKYNASLVSQWTVAQLAGAAHVSADGTNLYVSEGGSTHRVQKSLISTGAAGSPASFGTTGTGAGQFQEPHGIANNATHVWVTDRVRNKVIKFTVAGVYVSEFGATGTAQGQFQGPTGVTLDLAGNIYVCDTGNNRIQKFDSAGTWLATFGGSAGNGDGQFNAPEGIAVDDTDNMWIADTGNHRIQVIDPSGVYIAKVGNYGSGSGQLNSPKDIALGDGYGYIADYGNKRISRIKVAAQHTHTNVVTIRTASGAVANNANGGATATCNADEICTGGGYSHNGGTLVHHGASNPTGNSWTSFVFNRSGAGITVTTYAVCLKQVI